MASIDPAGPWRVPLHLHLLAAAARDEGHLVRILDEQDLARIAQRLRQALSAEHFEAAVLHVPLVNADLSRQVRECVRICRPCAGLRVLLAGAGVALQPETWRRATGADLALTGEGEVALIMALVQLEHDKLPTTGVISGPRLPNLRRLGSLWPTDRNDWSAFRRLGAGWPVEIKRGCPRSCTHCPVPLVEGACWRIHDPQRVMEEVALGAATSLPFVEVESTAFGLPREHAISCCELLAHRPYLPLLTLNLHPLAVNMELVGAMNAAGFIGVAISALSASDNILGSLGCGYTVSDLCRAADWLRHLHAPRLWSLRLGAPGEDAQTVRETVRFLKMLPQSDLVLLQHGWPVHPGTALHVRLLTTGAMSAEEDHLAPWLYQPFGLTVQTLETIVSAAQLGSRRLGSLAQFRSLIRQEQHNESLSGKRSDFLHRHRNRFFLSWLNLGPASLRNGPGSRLNHPTPDC